MTAMSSGATSYCRWKYSEMSTLSSGTTPLMALTTNLPVSLPCSFFRCDFRYGDGVTNTNTSLSRTTSLMSLLKLMRFTSKATLLR